MIDEIAQLLKRAIGVDASTVGPAVIGYAVKTRMAACGVEGVREYTEHLRHSPAEMQALTEAVVVPETWFFRDEKTFEALSQMVMNEWAAAHFTGVLRVLSVPCSTGEEPYSIAMALHDAGLPPQRFTIDAVDVSAVAIAHAKRRIYSRNAFRGREHSYRERHFRPAEQGYELSADIAKQVHFHRGNLIDADWLAGTEPYDVIFCRNVLIYFDAATQERVLRKLGRLLAADGTLFVGPSEAFITRGSGFKPVHHPSAFACRKSSARRAAPVQEPAAKKAAPLREPPPHIRKPPAKPKAAPAEAPAAPEGLASAHALADAGRLPEALAACEAHLKSNGASADGHFLLGLIYDAMGHPEEAGDCYRKAVYLEPNHPEALLHLAILAEQRGDRAGASRLQRRARRNEEAAPR